MMENNIVRLAAPAKVNLNLNITGRRADGYHLLDSVVVFTAFGDVIDVTPAAQATDTVTVTGPFADSLTGSDDNICLRALSAFREAGGAAPGMALTIDKQIPVGAGLGGGSSDAAAVLRHVNATSPAPLSAGRLAEVGLSIGADVPVCLAGTAQRMAGIGEILKPVYPPPHGHLVLAKPEAVLATADVFRHRNEAASRHRPVTGGQDVHRIVAQGNDLQGAAIDLVPGIGTVLDQLGRCDGVIAAQMSGSGSACFGLFETGDAANRATDELSGSGLWAAATDF